MKAVVAAFNQEKALVGAFYVITNLRMDLFEALVSIPQFLVSLQLVLGRGTKTDIWTFNFEVFSCVETKIIVKCD